MYDPSSVAGATMSLFGSAPSARSARLRNAVLSLWLVLIILRLATSAATGAWLTWLAGTLGFIGTGLAIAWLFSRINDGRAVEERLQRRSRH